MAPKKNARESTPSAAASPVTKASPVVKSAPVSPKPSAGAASWDVVLQNIYNHYINETTQRTKLIDAFLVFLVTVGALQFLYCVLAGNYPFNAFLSGFSATVGQFVLAVSLRVQTNDTKSEFPSVSPERAFADFVVCSLILHVFCINFIN
ncbi:Putative DAD family protein [[Torrubiella] hemipterigena]|uniref:Dolichyl-diphosphooligosaccharide--protein glycosyltransferase subunit OST2 n=1 Tax=[Torrubiella] hemipterigena TaxID=1531966 RepID=A0A0A1TTI5_9HYPO|nr:Putative DAD family protein [[Torrubiella] hemipterigena]